MFLALFFFFFSLSPCLFLSDGCLNVKDVKKKLKVGWCCPILWLIRSRLDQNSQYRELYWLQKYVYINRLSVQYFSYTFMYCKRHNRSKKVT